MEIGLIGLSGSGKTTVFNALTGSHAPTIPGAAREPHVAVVNVPDARVDKLVAMFQPKKTVYASVRYVDVPGQATESARKGLPESVLAHLATTDMLLAVLRGFTGTASDTLDVGGDADALDFELIVSDLSKVENRLPRLELSLKKVTGKERERLELEKRALEQVRPVLEAGKPIRTMELAAEEEAVLRGFSFLTQKAILYLVNTAENDEAREGEWLAPLRGRTEGGKVALAVLAGQIEQEIAQLAPEDRQAFLADYGIAEPGSSRIIQRCYELLGLRSFFTVGPKEVHAWTITAGMLAPQAAGVIHSDFERGFIRAEVTPYDALVKHGSLKVCREKALLRTEGKNYLVQDGDVMEFLFSV